jgi:RNA polymerase sigma-70 factor, ECF subfamily
MPTAARKTVVVPPAVLFERIKAGDEEAFNQLYAGYHARVLASVKRYIHEPDIAEFIANGVFIRVWEVRNTAAGFKNRSALSTWLTRIAFNAALMHLRAHKTESKYTAYSLDDIPKVNSPEQVILNRPVEFPSRDLVLEGVLDRKTLAQAIDQLPLSYRTIFEMRLVEGMSTDEVCQALKIKSNAVKSRLFRGRQILREILRGTPGHKA